MALTVEAASEQAERLDEERRFHHSQAAYHRRQARRRARALEQLRTDCARVGIKLIVTAPKEAQTDDRAQRGG